LYVAPRLHDRLEPRVTGWMAHEHPFSFETGPIEYASGAARFLHGSPGVPALYAAEAGYDIVGGIGIEAIRQKSVRQVQLLVDLARGEGFGIGVPEKQEERGGMVIVSVPSGEAVTRELLGREIIVDFRPGAGIRISPHFYTTDEELRHVIAEIRRILDTGAFRAHERRGGAGF